jgi:hypothetical protein
VYYTRVCGRALGCNESRPLGRLCPLFDEDVSTIIGPFFFFFFLPGFFLFLLLFSIMSTAVLVDCSDNQRGAPLHTSRSFKVGGEGDSIVST